MTLRVAVNGEPWLIIFGNCLAR